MTTLQITVDERVADAIRRRAELDGKTAEAWIAEVAIERAMASDDKSWIDEFLTNAKKHPGDSKGWKWNREELYDR